MSGLISPEKSFIRNYITGIVEFRETVEEVTDHLITAWENEGTDRPSEADLLAHINHVIDEDFGGWYHLLMEEHRRSEQYTRSYTKDQFVRLSGWLRIPYVWAVLGFLLVAMYYSYAHLSEDQIKWALFILLGIPMFSAFTFLAVIRRGKESIRQKAILKYSLVPYHLFYTSVIMVEKFFLDKSLIAGYSWSFVYAGLMLTLSLLIGLNAVATVREQIRLLPLKPVIK